MVSFTNAVLALAITTLSTMGAVQASTDYGFVMSHIPHHKDWCLTAVQGASEFANLGFRKCNFDGAPANQLFRFDTDGKLHSSLDDSKCMVLNHGDALFNGVRMRLADCDLATLLNTFALEGTESYLTVELPFTIDPAYCITNRGPNPHNSDKIHAKPCKDRDDYKWTFVLPVAEEEACDEETNGGCNSDPEVYTPLGLIETESSILINGEFWADSGTRDTDWYTFTITEPTLVTASVTSSSPAVLFLLEGHCDSITVQASTDSDTPGSPATFVFATPGEYVVFVATGNTGDGIYSGVPCDTYSASVNFTPLGAANVPEAAQEGIVGDAASTSAKDPAL